ncbi:MAG: S26 family signal peptidase, partial [Colwellia sp.]|nr:S26 family signal peptidase [Colwellia sp.]
MAVYFSIILVAITVITGIVWLADKFYLAPQRKLNVASAQEQSTVELPEETVATLMEPSPLV